MNEYITTRSIKAAVYISLYIIKKRKNCIVTQLENELIYRTKTKG